MVSCIYSYSSAIASQDFRKYTTVLTIMDYSYYIVLMAIGVTFPLITGGVDLSMVQDLFAIHWQVVIWYVLLDGQLDWNTSNCTFWYLYWYPERCADWSNGFATISCNLCTCMITRGLGSICSKELWYFMAYSWNSQAAGLEVFLSIRLAEPKFHLVLYGFLLLVLYYALCTQSYKDRSIHNCYW